MAGGTLSLAGAAGEANVQTFNGLNITAGNSNITGTSAAGGSMTVNLGAINRTGGLINFNLPAAGNITTSNAGLGGWATVNGTDYRSEEHTSELQSLMRNSYADFCLKTNTNIQTNNRTN